MRTLLAVALTSILLQVMPVGAQNADPCAGLLPTRLADTDYAVSASDQPVALREEPHLDAPVVRSAPPDEILRASGRPTCADHTRWARMVWGGDIGWAAEASQQEYWLEPYMLPEPVVVSIVDGATTRVASDLLSFDMPAELAGVVTMQPRIGTNYRDAMRVFPNYSRYALEPVEVNGVLTVAGTIDVFRTADWEAISPGVEATFAHLRDTLADGQPLPPADDDWFVPDIPAGGAARSFAGPFAYVDFEGGSGLRYISHYTQMGGQIHGGLVYRFQGLTDDGAFFISAEIPVSVPESLLPPFDLNQYLKGGDFESENGYYQAYLAELIANLEAQSDAISPGPATLDALFGSMWVGEVE